MNTAKGEVVGREGPYKGAATERRASGGDQPTLAVARAALGTFKKKDGSDGFRWDAVGGGPPCALPCKVHGWSLGSCQPYLMLLACPELTSRCHASLIACRAALVWSDQRLTLLQQGVTVWGR